MTDYLTFNVSNVLVESDNAQSLSYPWILITPEWFNLIFIIIGVYTMYFGIEIYHPLYAILFLNLIIALATTVINLFIFMIMCSEQYVRISNAINGISIGFHFNCWCVSSILRYVYIMHDSWIERRMRHIKFVCVAVISITFVCSFALLLPIYSYAVHLGNLLKSFF